MSERGACHLAVDIGASSGRHIVGQVVDGRMELTEVYRFENGLTHQDGHLCWDIDALADSIYALVKYPAIAKIASEKANSI